MDLGIKNKPGEPVPSLISVGESKVNYPGLSIRDENVEKVKGGHDCKVGDTYTAAVTLKVTGLRDDQYGKSIDFDVTNMDDFSPLADGGDSEVEEGDESDAFGYDRAAVKSNKPSVPPPSKKDLTEY